MNADNKEINADEKKILVLSVFIVNINLRLSAVY